MLAGGGVKGGMAYGATDEFGFKAVENVVHVHEPARDDSSPDGLRPRETYLPLRRSRFSPDRRTRKCGESYFGVREKKFSARVVGESGVMC